MYFASKKDFLYTLVIWGSSVAILLLYLLDSTVPKTAVVLVGGIIALLMWVWFGTGYRIDDGEIKITCGPFRMKVKIDEIKKIKKTRNPITAPALSMDRLIIMYGQYKTIQVAPENEKEFLKLLSKENPKNLESEEK